MGPRLRAEVAKARLALAAIDLVAAGDGAGRILGSAGVPGDKLGMLFVAADGPRAGGRRLPHAVAAMGARWVDVNGRKADGAG